MTNPSPTSSLRTGAHGRGLGAALGIGASLLLLSAASVFAGDDAAPAPKPLDGAPRLLDDASVVSMQTPFVVPPGARVPIALTNHGAELITVRDGCAGSVVLDEDGAPFEVNDSTHCKKGPPDEIAPGATRQLCVWDQRVEAGDAKRVALAPGRYRFVVTAPLLVGDVALELDGSPSTIVEISRGTPIELDAPQTITARTIVHLPDESHFLRLDDVMEGLLVDGNHVFAASLTVFDDDGHPTRLGLTLDGSSPQRASADFGDYTVALQWVDAWSDPPTASVIVIRRTP